MLDPRFHDLDVHRARTQLFWGWGLVIAVLIPLIVLALLDLNDDVVIFLFGALCGVGALHVAVTQTNIRYESARSNALDEAHAEKFRNQMEQRFGKPEAK